MVNTLLIFLMSEVPASAPPADGTAGTAAFPNVFSSLPKSTKLLIIILVVMILAAAIGSILFQPDLNKVKANRVGNGQYGDASFANRKELAQDYDIITYDPRRWRRDPKSRPTEPGYLLGDWHVSSAGNKVRKNPKAKSPPYYLYPNGSWHGGVVKSYLCTKDVHAMLTASSGGGKTAFFLNPQMEYALATGISFLVTDTKGDIQRFYGNIAKKCYGYKSVLIDLRNPMRSARFNVMNMVNKYTDLYKQCDDPHSEEAIRYLAKRETYAKICAKTIIMSGTTGNFGQNTYFYDTAEGLLAACILIVSEYAGENERHIISVYNLIQSIAGTKQDENNGEETNVQALLNELPASDSKIVMLAGAAAQNGGDGQASVLSTALSRLISFINSETEQILCFNSDVDAEEFVKEKTMVVITMPEENPTVYFIASLVIQELYRELLTIADEHGGSVPATDGFRGSKPRVTFFLDEFGTIPPIDSATMMFSAARSRRIFFVPIVQGSIQLDKNYGKEGGAIIRDNCQLQMFTAISPTSDDANAFSKTLGNYTVQTGSISSSAAGDKSTRSSSRNMMAKPLMSADEIRKMPQGEFIIMRTGQKPIKAHFDLFLDWGIPPFPKDQLEMPVHYDTPSYATHDGLVAAIRSSKEVEDFGTNETVNNTLSSAEAYKNEQKAADQAAKNAAPAAQPAKPADSTPFKVVQDSELDSDDDDDEGYYPSNMPE